MITTTKNFVVLYVTYTIDFQSKGDYLVLYVALMCHQVVVVIRVINSGSSGHSDFYIQRVFLSQKSHILVYRLDY